MACRDPATGDILLAEVGPATIVAETFEVSMWLAECCHGRGWHKLMHIGICEGLIVEGFCQDSNINIELGSDNKLRNQCAVFRSCTIPMLVGSSPSCQCQV